MRLFVRPSIISGLFTDLAAGWLGIVLISPLSLIQPTPEETFFAFTKAIFNSIVCLVLAEIIIRIEKNNTPV